MPASLALQEAFGEDLQVVFVERQGSGHEASLRFALARRWLGGRALWTSEAPCSSGSRSLPSAVLLDNDGRVLLVGNPLALKRELEREIAEQVRLRRAPPEGSPRVVCEGLAEAVRGRWGRALELLAAAATDEREPVAREAGEAAAVLRADVERRLARAQWLAENGWLLEGQGLVAALAKGGRGGGKLLERVQALEARLDSKEWAAEREAARAFARLAKRFHESGGEPAAARELERLAERSRGTQVAQRALELARLAGEG